MKKIILMLSLLIFIFPMHAFAVEYDIEKTAITAELQEDGTVHVEERHTYQFEGEFSGISRTLIPKDNAVIEDVKAFEQGKELEVEQEDELYKVHRSGEDETVSVRLTYSIKGGVEVYSDVAQFYWPFFDSSNESDYENMTITVVPPEPSEAKAAYGYDAAYHTVDSGSDGTVVFDMGEVPEGKNGDIRVAYDSALFPQAELSSDEAMLTEILNDEAKLNEKMIARQERHELWSGLGPYITGAFFLLAFVLFLVGFRRRKETLREAERKRSGTGRFPETTMSLPAVLMFGNHGQVTIPMMTPALLELVRKGNVEEGPEGEFRAVNRETDYPHETLLMNWLFDEVGENGTFKVEDLEEYLEDEDHIESYQENFRLWSEAVKQEVKQYDLYEESTKARWTAGVAGLAILPFTILFPVYEVFIWMTAAIALFFYFLIFSLLYRPLTFEGQRLKQELEPLKTGDEWQQWEEKDQISAYLYQVGAGKRKSDVDLPASAVTVNDLAMFMILAGTLDQSFRQADQTASVSAATTGAGAGGGAGVGGGGGGSGAF
ncbi:DUF2207 domain-containing protein [Salimicrobium jeotgali]|uniref:DUF2207 domain-containing protein n=1 Tax=Salimicrobium jeotgali TaxID=1230341 RepID=UPI000C839C94|nr:DUF2207 domain-containing protein [Salimicrobium jeotgali]